MKTFWQAQTPEYNRNMLSVGMNGLGDLTRRWIANFTVGKSMLDVGCGTGMGYEAGGEQARYVGVDFTSQMIEGCKEQYPDAEWILADVHSLPFENREFDVAVARHVFDHIDDYRPGIAEMRRVAHTVVIVLFHPIGSTYRDDSLGVIDRAHDDGIFEAVGTRPERAFYAGSQTIITGPD